MATETRFDVDPIPLLEIVPETVRGGTPHSSAAGRRAADGSLLADRVKSLQLPPEVTANRSRMGWLKWAVLAPLLVGACAGNSTVPRAKGGGR